MKVIPRRKCCVAMKAGTFTLQFGSDCTITPDEYPKPDDVVYKWATERDPDTLREIIYTGEKEDKGKKYKNEGWEEDQAYVSDMRT